MFIPTNNHPSFFITLSVYNKAKIFLDRKIVNVILDSWKFCADKYRFVVDNFVIMPNHLHFIIHFINDNDTLIKKESIGLRGKYTAISSKIMDNFIKSFKKYTAHEIVKILKDNNSIFLSRLLLKKEKKKKHWYSLWLDDKFIVIINSKKVLKIKQKYIRINPVKAGLVKNIKDYEYVK